MAQHETARHGTTQHTAHTAQQQPPTRHHDRDFDAPPPRADLYEQQHACATRVPHIHHTVEVRVLRYRWRYRRQYNVNVRHDLKQASEQALLPEL